ncbi:unnamed protein product [Cyprideis torosa]|uniref:Uncharacterized protein n=1 Tax=Cyprideis torosa TaxID=163714 RepID=A0A7R8WCA7_9CRUS|nr:unnamed protein product [Cyprideis torosa]CAG0887295.1 unnamed protein product [Cyprideis torosa]
MSQSVWREVPSRGVLFKTIVLTCDYETGNVVMKDLTPKSTAEQIATSHDSGDSGVPRSVILTVQGTPQPPTTGQGVPEQSPPQQLTDVMVDLPLSFCQLIDPTGAAQQLDHPELSLAAEEERQEALINMAHLTPEQLENMECVLQTEEAKQMLTEPIQKQLFSNIQRLLNMTADLEGEGVGGAATSGAQHEANRTSTSAVTGETREGGPSGRETLWVVGGWVRSSTTTANPLPQHSPDQENRREIAVSAAPHHDHDYLFSHKKESLPPSPELPPNTVSFFEDGPTTAPPLQKIQPPRQSLGIGASRTTSSSAVMPSPPPGGHRQSVSPSESTHSEPSRRSARQQEKHDREIVEKIRAENQQMLAREREAMTSNEAPESPLEELQPAKTANPQSKRDRKPPKHLISEEFLVKPVSKVGRPRKRVGSGADAPSTEEEEGDSAAEDEVGGFLWVTLYLADELWCDGLRARRKVEGKAQGEGKARAEGKAPGKDKTLGEDKAQGQDKAQGEDKAQDEGKAPGDDKTQCWDKAQGEGKARAEGKAQCRDKAQGEDKTQCLDKVQGGDKAQCLDKAQGQDKSQGKKMEISGDTWLCPKCRGVGNATQKAKAPSVAPAPSSQPVGGAKKSKPTPPAAAKQAPRRGKPKQRKHMAPVIQESEREKKKEPAAKRTCLGPECSKVAPEEAMYCSDACLLQYAKTCADGRMAHDTLLLIDKLSSKPQTFVCQTANLVHYLRAHPAYEVVTAQQRPPSQQSNASTTPSPTQRQPPHHLSSLAARRQSSLAGGRTAPLIIPAKPMPPSSPSPGKTALINSPGASMHGQKVKIIKVLPAKATKKEDPPPPKKPKPAPPPPSRKLSLGEKSSPASHRGGSGSAAGAGARGGSGGAAGGASAAAEETEEEKRQRQDKEEKNVMQKRECIRRFISHALRERCKGSEDMRDTSDETCGRIAKKIEHALFDFAGRDVHGKKYMNKYRVLAMSIKDKQNNELFRRIISGNLRPSKLVAMEAHEYADEAMRNQREMELKQELEKIKETELQREEIFLVKSHKGEIVYESEEGAMHKDTEVTLPDDLPDEDLGLPTGSGTDGESADAKKHTTSSSSGHRRHSSSKKRSHHSRPNRSRSPLRESPASGSSTPSAKDSTAEHKIHVFDR